MTSFLLSESNFLYKLQNLPRKIKIEHKKSRYESKPTNDKNRVKDEKSYLVNRPNINAPILCVNKMIPCSKLWLRTNPIQHSLGT